MTTEPSLLTPQPSPEDKLKHHPLSAGRAAFFVGWFLGWPIVVLACLHFMTLPISTPAIWLLGSGSFVWFVSIFGVCDILLTMIETRWRSQLIYRCVVIGWFVGGIPLTGLLYIYVIGMIEPPPWFDVTVFVSGAVLWLASCYGVYDLILAMVEERWPEAKSIREVIGNLFRFFLRSHHHVD